MYLIKLLNIIKISMLNKKKYFYYSYNHRNMIFIKKLIQINLIKGLKIIGDKKIKIFIQYINDKPIYSNIKFLYKPSNKFIVNLKTLIKINKYRNNGTYLLFTSKGFITNHEAVLNKTGGILFCKIN
jgi:ribosomal protein S8